MTFSDKHELCKRLFSWQHRRFVAAFHDTENSDRAQQMAQWGAIRRRVVALCVRYGVMHSDCLKG